MTRKTALMTSSTATTSCAASATAATSITSATLQARLWMLQRLSAMVLALCVVVHIAVIIVAVRNGLTGAEILGRTRGNAAWFIFYAVFVIASAVHVPIGVLKIAEEWWRWRGRGVQVAATAFGLLVLVAGLRAVWAVTAGGAP
jgi:fumarate reductase subunit C